MDRKTNKKINSFLEWIISWNSQMLLQKSVQIYKKTRYRPCLDNDYRKDPECSWQWSIYLWSFPSFSKGFPYSKSQNTSFKIRVLWYQGHPHDAIKSSLTSRKHTHINGVDSHTLTCTHVIPPDSYLWSLLFLIYVNYMSKVTEHSEIHHFVHDTKLLVSGNSMKKVRLIVHWLRANSISFNIDKTEIIIFCPKGKDTTKKINFRISDQQIYIYISKQVKCLDLMVHESTTWSSYIRMLKAKLSRANGLLAKLKCYTSNNLLTTIYIMLFSCHTWDMIDKFGEKPETNMKVMLSN